MRLSVCGLPGRQMVVVFLLTLLLLFIPFFILWGQGDIDSLAEAAMDPLARSEALRQHVRNACRALDFSEIKKQSTVTLSHLLYDDAHKVIYCYIPKVACTSWKRVMLKMNEMVPPELDIATLDRDMVHSHILPRLASSKNLEEKLKTYKKFMFVRHPFERAVSAYRNKLERDDKLFIGKEIKKMYRGTTEVRGRNVAFAEFIRYISEPRPRTAEQRNEHWLPMHELCDPCSVKYDFIGTKENLEEDADYVLKWLGVTELVGAFPASDEPVNASQYVSKYLKQLTRTEILAFYAKFLPDYLLFDYEFL